MKRDRRAPSFGVPTTLRTVLTRPGGAPTWLPPLLILAVLTLVVEVVGSGYFTLELIGIKLSTTLALILVATGQTVVVLRGGIDLSVGGTLSIATAIAATRTDGSLLGLLPWAVVILGVGALVGVVNSLVITALQIQPFVVTLATWSIAEGIAMTILPADGGTVPAAWFGLGSRYIGDVPAILIVLVALMAWWLWFRTTRTAQRLRAVGSSERGAFLNGVSIARTNLIAYGMAGFFAALAGLVYASQTGAGSPTVGAEYILPTIAAVVIGGTSLAGGRGGLLGTVFGALILTVISDAVFLLHLRSYWQPVVSGVILVLAVALAQFDELAAFARRRGWSRRASAEGSA